jgi:aprataxin
LNEVFSCITFCQNDNDVKEAIKTYSELSPSDKLSSGEFGQKNKKESVRPSIMNFLKKSVTEENSQKKKKGTALQEMVPEMNSLLLHFCLSQHRIFSLT